MNKKTGWIVQCSRKRLGISASVLVVVIEATLRQGAMGTTIMTLGAHDSGPVSQARYNHASLLR